MNHVARLALTALAVTALTTACRRRPETAPEPAAQPAMNDDSIRMAEDEARRRAEEEAARRAREAADRARADSLARDESRRNQMMSEARNTLAAMIYFDLDRADLSDAARATLDAKLPLLRANPDVRLRVAGHADNRGSDEYNLALGQRRAAAARRYLVQQGVDGSRIETVSFGEERPIAEGNDESAWSQNRRDEFEIIAGGDNMTLPRED
ncbi:MAG TPA: peptidoglycan-associated lipoprotein Pal [Gemmatimonadaceae bacterium]|nr:peptidoglycan-associated lipoprotein Pal [Gemmatimonadaceae bacterium]